MRAARRLLSSAEALSITTSRSVIVSPGAHSRISPPAAELAAESARACGGGEPLRVSAPQRLAAARVAAGGAITIDGKLESGDVVLSAGGALSLGTLRGGSLALSGARVAVGRLLEGATVRCAGAGGVRVARLMADDAELAAAAGPGGVRVEAAFARRLALRAGGGGGGVFLGGLHGRAEVAAGGGRVEVCGITGALSVRGAGEVVAQFDAPRGRSDIEAEGGVELLLAAPLPARGLRVDAAGAARVVWELGEGAAYEDGRVVARGAAAAAAVAAVATPPSSRGGSGKVAQGEAGAPARGFYDDARGEAAEGEACIAVACKGPLRVTLLSYLELIQRRVAQRAADANALRAADAKA